MARTAEQQEQAAERRERFRELCRRIAAMSEDQRAALAARLPIVTTEGHAISPFNSCLILSQFTGTPTIVGGFQQWRKRGRMVRKGEHGLAIWIPKGNRKADEQPKANDAEPASERTGFIMGYVFDVSQTDEHSAE